MTPQEAQEIIAASETVEYHLCLLQKTAAGLWMLTVSETDPDGVIRHVSTITDELQHVIPAILARLAAEKPTMA